MDLLHLAKDFIFAGQFRFIAKKKKGKEKKKRKKEKKKEKDDDQKNKVTSFFSYRQKKKMNKKIKIKNSTNVWENYNFRSLSSIRRKDNSTNKEGCKKQTHKHKQKEERRKKIKYCVEEQIILLKCLVYFCL